MKHFIALALCAMPLAGFAQLHVSTEPQPRMAVLEEFTGMRCSNCPDGHKIANDIAEARPGEFISMNLHTGYYANPRVGDPDYRTDYADELASLLKVAAFPMGTVNREAYYGSRVITRDQWRNAVRAITSQTSPVNLWSEAAYDAATRSLTVDIEGYFTSDMSQSADLTLNVILLQDNIIGPQVGGSDTYTHNHMVRTTLTGIWGEPISGNTAGQSFTEKYTYTVPADFKGVECKPEDLKVVVTINEGKDRIITATETRPTSPSFPEKFGATLLYSRMGMPMIYSYKFIDGRIKSEMTSDITSLSFETRVNFGEWIPAEIECLIPAGTTADFAVPVDYKLGVAGLTKLTARLTAINGKEIDPQEITFSFIAPTPYAKDLTFDIQTDRHPSDNVFAIRDADGKIVKEFGPFTDDAPTLHSETVTLDPGYYCFEVSDSWGDGLGDPEGWVKIYDKESKKDYFRQQGVYSYGLRAFFSVPDNTTPDPKPGAIENVDASQAVSMTFDNASRCLAVTGGKVKAIQVVTADGRSVASGADLRHLPSGIYVARAIMADGSVVTLKFTL